MAGVLKKIWVKYLQSCWMLIEKIIIKDYVKRTKCILLEHDAYE
jgi:hypothetical protein